MANHRIFAPTFHGDVDAVRKILDEDPALATVLVNVRDAKNLTPLHVAASRGQSCVAKLLLDYGADVHGPTAANEWTPLVFAAYRGHVEVAEVLIAHGAGVSPSDGNPIHFAGQRKHKELCRLLVRHGAIEPLMTDDDADALHLFQSAYSYDSQSVSDILERRPELIHSTDVNGRSVLHEVCTHGDTNTARVLLKFGVDVSLRDSSNQTAADRATAHRQHGVTKLLKKHANESR